MSIENGKQDSAAVSAEQDEAMVKGGTALEQLYEGYFGSEANCAFVLEHIPEKIFALPEPVILDAGSSRGTFGEFVAARYAERGAHPHLILADLNEAALRNVETEASRVVSNIRELPFRDSSVDLVLMRSVLHYEATADAQQQLLAEAHRVLRSGGVLISQFGAFGTPAEADAFNAMFRAFGRYVLFPTRESGVALHEKVFGSVDLVTEGPSLTETMHEFSIRMSGAEAGKAAEYIESHRDELKTILVNDKPPYAWRVPFVLVSCSKR